MNSKSGLRKQESQPARDYSKAAGEIMGSDSLIGSLEEIATILNSTKSPYSAIVAMTSATITGTNICSKPSKE